MQGTKDWANRPYTTKSDLIKGPLRSCGGEQSGAETRRRTPIMRTSVRSNATKYVNVGADLFAPFHPRSGITTVSETDPPANRQVKAL